MSNDQQLGQFELTVLVTLLRQEDEVYGVRLHAEIEELSDRPVSVGAVYTTLARLERKGMVESRKGEPTPERGGRAKRYFAVAPAGREAVRETLRLLDRLTRGLPLAWECE